MSSKQNEFILVMDFGGQYNQLIARRVRECNVYCEVFPYTMSIEEIKKMQPKGIIFTGGPNSVYEKDSAVCSAELLKLGIPVLGICYGSQLMAHLLGGKVATAPVSEYGKTEVSIKGESSKIFAGVSKETLDSVIKGVWPFLLAETLLMFLLVFFPSLVLVPARWFY